MSLKGFIVFCCNKYLTIKRVPCELYQPLPVVINLRRSIDSFQEEDIPQNFRFRNKLQLKSLLNSFQLPEAFISMCGHRFNTEELLLVTLFRFHTSVIGTDDTFKMIFGWPEGKVYMGVKLFVSYFVHNWGYLIQDNIEYWVPSLPYFSECIRNKLLDYGCAFPHSYVVGGFNVFGFIDNVVYPTCRPGSGPSRDGVRAPRYNPLIQRSFYNGWKSQHGIKYQTIGLPNGLMFHTWGPIMST